MYLHFTIYKIQPFVYSKYTVRHMGIRHGRAVRASTKVQGSSVPWIQVRESEKAKTTEEAETRRVGGKPLNGGDSKGNPGPKMACKVKDL